MEMAEILIPGFDWVLSCSPTGMFALPDPGSHVNSAAFAQARLRLGSPSAQVCSPLLRDAARLRITSLEMINC